jgi:para-nitrobenzyl esterase
MYAWAEINVRTSTAKTFFYRFNSKFGNGHGAELPYVFNYPFGGSWNAEQQEMGRIVSRYWSRFATTGDPNGEGLPTWPAYDTRNKRVMSLGIETASQKMPDLEAHLLMSEYQDSKRRGARQKSPIP